MSNPNNADVVTSRIPLHWMLEPRHLDPFSEVPVKNTIDNAINAMLVYLDDRVGAGPVRDRAQDKLQEAAFLATRAIVQAGVYPAPFPGQVSGLMVNSHENEIRGLKAQLDTEMREAANLRQRNKHLEGQVESFEKVAGSADKRAQAAEWATGDVRWFQTGNPPIAANPDAPDIRQQMVAAWIRGSGGNLLLALESAAESYLYERRYVRHYSNACDGISASLNAEKERTARLVDQCQELEGRTQESFERGRARETELLNEIRERDGIIRALQGQTDEYADFIRTLKARLEELHDMMTGKAPIHAPTHNTPIHTPPSSGFVHPATVPVTARGKPWDISREEVARGGLEEALTEAMNRGAHTREVGVIITDYPGGKTYGNAPDAGLSEATLAEALRYFSTLTDPPAHTTAHIKPE